MWVKADIVPDVEAGEASSPAPLMKIVGLII
jgi:hypothetical protein